MILGLSVAYVRHVHVVISLIAIVAGIIVMFGMLGSNRMPGLTAIFLLLTILTSATGFRDSAAGVRKISAVAHRSAFFRWGCWRSPVSRCTARSFPARGAGSMC